MKKIYYLLISFYSILILGIIIHYIFGLFNFDWQLILNNVERLESFSFFVIVLTFSLTMLMVLGIKVIQMVTLSTIQINLKNILEGRELQAGIREINSFNRKSAKVRESCLAKRRDSY